MTSPVKERCGTAPPWVTSMALFAVVLPLIGSPVCLVDCIPQYRIEGASANGAFRFHANRVTPYRFEFTLQRNDTTVSTGMIDVSGHNLSAIIEDTGAYFVLNDTYEGLAVYDTQGRRIGNLTVDELLTVRERRTTPGRWGCHPEGRWARESHQVSFIKDRSAVEAITHAGRRIVIDLAAARIVEAEADVEAETDAVRVDAIVVAGGTMAVVTSLVVWLWMRRKRQWVATIE